MTEDTEGTEVITAKAKDYEIKELGEIILFDGVEGLRYDCTNKKASVADSKEHKIRPSLDVSYPIADLETVPAEIMNVLNEHTQKFYNVDFSTIVAEGYRGILYREKGVILELNAIAAGGAADLDKIKTDCETELSTYQPRGAQAKTKKKETKELTSFMTKMRNKYVEAGGEKDASNLEVMQWAENL